MILIPILYIYVNKIFKSATRRGGNIFGGRERRGSLDRQELHLWSFVKLRIHLTYYYIGFYIYYINLFIKRARKLERFF